MRVRIMSPGNQGHGMYGEATPMLEDEDAYAVVLEAEQTFVTFDADQVPVAGATDGTELIIVAKAYCQEAD